MRGKAFLWGFAVRKEDDVEFITKILEAPEGSFNPSTVFPPAWKGKSRRYYLERRGPEWPVMFTPTDERGQDHRPLVYWGMDAAIRNPWIILNWNQYSKEFGGFHCDVCAEGWLNYIIGQQEDWERGFKFISKHGIPESIQKH